MKNMCNFNGLYLFFIIVFAGSNAFSSTAKFIVFGDFGTRDENQRINAKGMIDFCEKKGCDFGISVGDNIYPRGVENLLDGKPDYVKGTPNYEIITKTFVDYYKDLNVPVYMSFGNHDEGNEGPVSIFNDLFKNSAEINRRTVALMLNQLNYTFNNDNPILKDSLGRPSRLWNFRAPYYHAREKGEVSLLAIDTNTYPHAALDSKNQLDLANPKNNRQGQWLKNEIETIQDGWTFVFGHVPIYSHGFHGSIDAAHIMDTTGQISNQRKAILDLLCEQEVDFYLSGHDHHLEIDKHMCPNGHMLISIISGAAAKEDRIYKKAFPIFSKEVNLIWGNGQEYKGDSFIYGPDDKVLGFTHIDISDDGKKALVTMKLTKGASNKLKDGCFEVERGKHITKVDCK